PSRSRQPIQPRDDQHVAGFKPADRLGKLWPVSLGAGRLLLEDVAAARRLKRRDLAGKVLIPRRDPSVSESSHFPSHFETDFRKKLRRQGRECCWRATNSDLDQRLTVHTQRAESKHCLHLAST